MDEGADSVGHKAKEAIADPVDEGTVVEEQVHRREETHARREQPQEAEPLLNPVPSAKPHR